MHVVLQSSPNSLQHHLVSLPESLHSFAIHVAIPEILKHGHLALDAASLSTSSAMKVVQEVVQYTDVSTLNLINIPAVGDATHFNSVLCSMLRRRSLSEVKLSLEISTSATNETVRELFCALEGSTNLKALHMEHPEPAPSSGVQSIEVKSLFSLADQLCGQLSVASLPSIQELSLQFGMGRFELDNTRQSALCDVLQQHTDLTSLHLDCGVGRTSVLAGMLGSLIKLRSLNLSLYLHAAKKRHSRTDIEPFIAALAGLTVLSSLKLSVSHSEDESTPLEVCSALSSLPNVKHLDFSGFQMQRRDITELSKALELMGGLQSLALHVPAIDESVVQVLVSLSVSSSSSCTSLSLRAADPYIQMLSLHINRSVPGEKDAFLKCIARAATQFPGCVAQLTCLKHLQLHNCTFADSSLITELLNAAETREDMNTAHRETCCRVLRQVQEQFHRDIQSCDPPNAFMFEGLKCLTKLSQLIEVQLSASSMHSKPLGIEFHPLQGFLSLGKQQLPKLAYIAIHGASMEDSSRLSCLSRFPLDRLSLSECESSLDSWGTRVGSSIIHDLDCLTSVTMLTSLSLKFSSRSKVLNWDDLASLVKLKELSVTSGDLTKSDCETFARCLWSMSDLRSLVLHGCQIASDNGNELNGCLVASGNIFAKLAKGLATVTQITRLDFSKCVFHGTIDEIASTIGSLRFLRSLVLSGCISTASSNTSTILGCLQPNQQIEFVDFRNLGLRSETWDAVIWLLGTVPSLRCLKVDFVPESLPHVKAEAILALISNDDPTRCVSLVSLFSALL